MGGDSVPAISYKQLLYEPQSKYLMLQAILLLV